MVIKEERPITMAEVTHLAGDTEKAQNIKRFIKDFNKMSYESAKKMEEELKGLNIIKLKDQHIVKIIDFMPRDAADLNKIVSDASLDAEETDKVINVVKNY